MAGLSLSPRLNVLTSRTSRYTLRGANPALSAGARIDGSINASSSLGNAGTIDLRTALRAEHDPHVVFAPASGALVPRHSV